MHATTEGPVEALMSEGQSLMSAELAEVVDLPRLEAHLETKVGFPECPVCQPTLGILRRQCYRRC